MHLKRDRIFATLIQSPSANNKISIAVIVEQFILFPCISVLIQRDINHQILLKPREITPVKTV